MSPTVDTYPRSDSLPETADVVIIGGGIVGLSTALSLVRRGVRSLVFEKGSVAAEQSSRNWGWIRRMGRDPRELPLILEAMRLWDGMAEAVGCEGHLVQSAPAVPGASVAAARRPRIGPPNWSRRGRA